jgi:hypothetical protein
LFYGGDVGVSRAELRTELCRREPFVENSIARRMDIAKEFVERGLLLGRTTQHEQDSVGRIGVGNGSLVMARPCNRGHTARKRNQRVGVNGLRNALRLCGNYRQSQKHNYRNSQTASSRFHWYTGKVRYKTEKNGF